MRVLQNELYVSYLAPFYNETSEGLTISAEQASRFAKEVAGDFNPIHDSGARRFCVPGDLLFALVVERYGLYANMAVHFRNMVGDQTPLRFARGDGGTITVSDRSGKVYLEAECRGEMTTDVSTTEGFTRQYVAFSGLNFPHYMKPLMQKHGVMFNPQRPLVIYDSMEVKMEQVGASGMALSFVGSTLEVDGKRADALLQFEMQADDRAIGTGCKKLVIGGLRPYDEQVMLDVVKEFYRLKDAFEASR